MAVGVNGFSAAPREQSGSWLWWGDNRLGAALMPSLEQTLGRQRRELWLFVIVCRGISGQEETSSACKWLWFGCSLLQRRLYRDGQAWCWQPGKGGGCCQLPSAAGGC